MIEKWEQQLDSFDWGKRLTALQELITLVEAGQIEFPAPTDKINMHCHTFYSYNSYGYSPSKYAWLAKRSGMALAGIVDFDVLDGLDEFIEAGRLLDLPTCGGLETRVFVPEFADKVMTSPGEPGITYHMGMGIPSGQLTGKWKTFQGKLKNTAQDRNRILVERVNAYLSSIKLDYEKDVLPLAPAGNPTERHICVAYARKAAEHFASDDELISFWSDKLGVDVSNMELPQGRDILNTIRSKTMKRGGPGYVVPDAGAFPRMAEVNEFVLAIGGIPTLTWLNGLSEGEQQLETLLDIAMASGVEAINIIPDRNFTPGVEDELVANLRAVIQIASQRQLPIIVGTEMNSPGQKFIDNFETAELSPYMPLFLQGARIVYAHSVLQRQCGLGYTSGWAKKLFPDRGERNQFYETVGREIEPAQEHRLAAVNTDTKPDDLFKLQ
ncbi:MAG: hypothetical protein JXA82_16110 [Sedimentisphaerales bacterium]|nr:hypothetical protein [Sedimentisphaerales bacterium]